MGPGADVVVSEYCFAVYPIVAKMFGGECHTVPAKNYGHDLPAMLERHHAENASGVRRESEQSRPARSRRGKTSFDLDQQRSANVLLVMDEAYIEFLSDPVGFDSD